MGAKSIGDIFLIGVDILRTTVVEKTKKILVQLGSVVGKTVDSDNAEWIQHVGFVSLPPDPEPGKVAAQAVAIRQPDHDVVIASIDLRGLELRGQLGPGETAVYAAGRDGTKQNRILLKEKMIALYGRKGGASGGAGMMIQLDTDGGGINIVDAYGNALTSGPDGWTMTSKGAVLKLGQDGNASLIGKAQTQVDGASVVIGSVAVPGLNSALTGPTGIAGKASLKVLIE